MAHLGLAYRIADQKWIAGHDSGDVRQEACLGLLEAARCFEEEGPASFATFARQVIERRLADRMKHVSRASRWCGQMPLSLDETIEVDDLEASNLHDLVPSDVDVVRQAEARAEVRRLSAAMAALTATERDALHMVTNGIPYRSHKRTDNAIQRARRKLREAA